MFVVKTHLYVCLKHSTKSAMETFFSISQHRAFRSYVAIKAERQLLYRVSLKREAKKEECFH